MGDSRTWLVLEEGWQQIEEMALIPMHSKLSSGGEHLMTKDLISVQDFVKVHTICYTLCNQKPNYSAVLYQRHGDSISNYLRDVSLPALENKSGIALLAEFVQQSSFHHIMNRWYEKVFRYLDRWYVKYEMSFVPTLHTSGMMKFKEIVFDKYCHDISDVIINMINEERNGIMIDRGLIRICISIFESMGMGSLKTYVQDFEAALLASTILFYKNRIDTWLSRGSTIAYLTKVEKCLDDERHLAKSCLNAEESEGKILQIIQKHAIADKVAQLAHDPVCGALVLLRTSNDDAMARMYRLFSLVEDGLTVIIEIFKRHVVECCETVYAEHGLLHGTISLSSQSTVTIPSSNTSRSTTSLSDTVIASSVIRDVGSTGAGALSRSLSSTTSTQHQVDTTPFTYSTTPTPSRSASSSAVDSGGGSADVAAPMVDDAALIRQLIGIHKKYTLLVKDRFDSNLLLMKALRSAFSDIVNRELLSSKMADLLCSFCDKFLKGGANEALTDVDLSQLLEDAVEMLLYLNEKDLFADIYRTLLAKRLLNQRSASNDMEMHMLGLLKKSCGSQFTSKLEGMLNDFTIGGDHAQSFAKYFKEKTEYSSHHQESNKIEFGVQLLTAGYWPTFKNVEVVLPPVMQRCIDVFREHYDARFPQRRLQWIHSLGLVTMKCAFGGSKGAGSYDIQVVPIQAIVLNHFSGIGPLNALLLSDVCSELGLVEDILKRTMHSLTYGKFKVLKKMSTAAGALEKEKISIKMTDRFCVNEQFSSPVRKFRIPMASLEESSSEKRVEEDRTIMIEAAVVRIMKARKSLSHQQLVSEILSQLLYFKPDPKLVKRRIESLIDREYIERDAETPSIYKYLA